MKKIHILIFCFSGLSCLKAQQVNSNPVQSLDVVYQQLTDSTVMVQTKVRLLDLFNEQKIHLKVFDASAEEPFYSVTYNLSENTVRDSQNLLYAKNEDIVMINLPVSVKLNVYRYEIYFEDANGNNSPKFSELK